MDKGDDNIDDALDQDAAEEKVDLIHKEEPPPAICQVEFLEWRSPREAGVKPTNLDNPLWKCNLHHWSTWLSQEPRGQCFPGL